MASNRYRSRRSIGKMVNRVDLRLEYLQKRPAPRRLQPYSIFTQSLSRHAIANENIATNAVDGDKIADNSIDNSHMQFDSINADNIQARTITADEIVAGTITAEEIMANTITADLIAAGTITATEIAANTITGDEIIANVKLEAPLVYGGGMRAYDIVNPDPSQYIGTVPSLPYVSIAARTYPAGVNTSQITCYDNGYVNIFAGAIQQVYINGGSGNPPSGWNSDNIVATRGWVSNNHANLSTYNGHVHSFAENNVVGTRNTSTPSDERLKKDIQPLDIGLDFIESLNPVKYKFINGGNKIKGANAAGIVSLPPGEKPEIEFKAGTRTHYGLIAQQVKEASDSITEDDFAGWVHTEDDVQMLRYDEFIAPLIKAVQELSEQNRELREEIKSLWEKVG